MFVARNIETSENVEASNALKKGAYCCRNCNEQVILAKGQKRRAHFRHGRNSLCAYGVGETWQHEEAKAAILEAARSRGLVAIPEVPVLSFDGDRRADVLIFAPQVHPPIADDKRRLAFEVQYSAIDSSNLVARTSAYMTAGVPVIWIPVIDQRKFKDLYRVRNTNLCCAAEYSTPFWVESIQSMHGHLWLYVPESKGFWRGWLLTHWRWKNYSEGYDSDGNQHTGGNHYVAAAKTRDLFLEGPYEFKVLKLVRVNHSKNKMIGPPGIPKFLVDLIPPNAGKVTPVPVERRKEQHIVNGRDTGHYDYVEWVQINDQWQKAAFDRIEALPTS
jgi:Competence protein CoiA-like family